MNSLVHVMTIHVLFVSICLLLLSCSGLQRSFEDAPPSQGSVGRFIRGIRTIEVDIKPEQLRLSDEQRQASNGKRQFDLFHVATFFHCDHLGSSSRACCVVCSCLAWLGLSFGRLS